MKTVSRTLIRCLVCGFSEVRTDEVVDHGLVFIAECLHCEHRWTSLEPIAVVACSGPPPSVGCFQRVAARVSREVTPAA